MLVSLQAAWRRAMNATVAGLLLAAWLMVCDALAFPKAQTGLRLRSLPGSVVLLFASMALFGAVLALTGAWLVSAVFVGMLAAALTLVSNIKWSVLGEPLVFSDFALVGALFQHPQFYFSALTRGQIALLIAGCVFVTGLLAGFSTTSLTARAVGIGLIAASGAAMTAVLRVDYWQTLVTNPDPDRDVLRHGLIATTIVYWSRWRHQPGPPACDLPAMGEGSNHLVVIVQCESFADPIDLFGAECPALPGLEAARSMAWQSGKLIVSGFGAYTMRTEYGVLFGRGEQQLGLRRFDPFLSAHEEVSWALPQRLKREDWTSVFVHPHDLRFYGRNKLMPAAGFDQLVGSEAFPSTSSSGGRYVTDEAVCDKILELAARERGATMIYAVTIENHGPWPPDKGEDGRHNGADYLRLLRRSDTMLGSLLDRLPRFGRPVTLCFFGDHRPSIPDVSEPGASRHTPYVVACFGADGVPLSRTGVSVDLTPAQLHHTILFAMGRSRAE